VNRFDRVDFGNLGCQIDHRSTLAVNIISSEVFLDHIVFIRDGCMNDAAGNQICIEEMKSRHLSIDHSSHLSIYSACLAATAIVVVLY
jgi:hypothetical protein